MNLSDYQFKSEFFRRKLAEEAGKAEALGEARGEVRGQARALFTMLASRGLAVSDAVRAQIVGCTDATTLDRWIARASTAATAEDVIRDV